MVNSQKAVAETKLLREIPQPLARADLLVQDTNVKVTAIQLNKTKTGLQLIIKTADGQKLVPLILPEANRLVIELTDATLDLATGNDFQETNPTLGIAAITATQVDEGNIQILIIGENNSPSAAVIPSNQGLVLTVNPEGNIAPAKPDTSINVIATGQGNDDNYFVPNATTATRTDTPILDTPQSIQIIPREVLQDQQVIRLDEALRNVSGVTFGGTDLGRDLDFSIRGFDDATILRNGFRQFNSGGTFPETANLEQIEVLKGPAAVLLGEIQPGGVINLVSKRPLSEPYYDIQAQFGNRNLFRPSIDISGPLTLDGNLLYRLNAVYQSGDEIQDFETDIERFFISPVITWKISDRTDLTIELEYLDEERPPTFGIPAIGEEIADIPFDQISSEPDDIGEEESINVGYDLEHRFSDNWKLRNGFRYTKQDASIEITFPFDIDDETGIITRFSGFQPEESESFSLNTNLVGEFATGPIDHQLLFGIDLNRTEDNFNLSTRLDVENPLEFDIFNPEFGTFIRPDPEDIPVFQDDENEINRLGIFIQDQISFTENLILLAGLRYDTVDQTTTINPTDFDPTSGEITQNNDDISPRVGLVYQPIPQVSLYGSYSESFAPNTELTVDSEPLEPETGKGFEFGVKTELLNKKLSLTLAYFNITQENVATEDPDDPFSFVATGEQKSQGIELDIVGDILPGWNIIASYAYIDAEITEDNIIEVGNRLNNAPENSASLSTNYQIQQGSLQGLGLGVGFNFVGEREGDLENSFQLDSYFITNAAVFYEPSNWRAAVNFRNIFDVDFISGASPVRVRGNNVGEPFTVIGSLSVTF
ncbi:MAG: TonB-dependent siderophore receptor [Cyanobacteria bacterium P01_G01_bin.67]